MRASSLRYLMKSGIRNLWSNRLMTVASVGTLIACLLIVGLAVLFSINVDNMVEYIGEQNELVVFLQLDAPEDYHLTMEEELSQIDGLGEVTFISREEAMDSVVDKYLGGDAGLLEGMDTDFLPDSFRVQITKPDQIDALVQAVGRIEYVDKVEAPTELTKTLVNIRQIVNTFGFAIIGALVVVSVVIITNTIRASVFTRRKEIGIMKYVGATNTFIRIPFVVEGIALGILAAIIAFFIVWGGYDVFVRLIDSNATSWLSSVTSHILPFSSVALRLMGYFMASGILVGGLGSAMSMRGYLKV